MTTVSYPGFPRLPQAFITAFHTASDESLGRPGYKDRQSHFQASSLAENEPRREPSMFSAKGEPSMFSAKGGA